MTAVQVEAVAGSSATTKIFRITDARPLTFKSDHRRGFLSWEAHSLSRLIDAGVCVPVPLAAPSRSLHSLVYEWIEADSSVAITRDVSDEAGRIVTRARRRLGDHLPSAERLTFHELRSSSRACAERERLTKLLARFVDGFSCGYGACHGDLWSGNLIVSAAGDIVLLDPKLQYAPRCFDLVSYCFHSPSGLVSDEMRDDLDSVGRASRLLGVVRELARCPQVPAEPWLEWALNGGTPPESHAGPAHGHAPIGGQAL